MEYWDHISEVEVDDAWRKGFTEEYNEYRRQFSLAQKRQYEGDFPLAIEVEPTYYCNLKCPMCPRVVEQDGRKNSHMNPVLWGKILKECKANGLRSMLMDHEAESMMNPRFFEMVQQVKDAGVIDIWLHTNANLLTKERSEILIDSGINKINFSIDAVSEKTYDKVRPGGNYQRVLKNVKDFLKIKLKKGAIDVRTRVSFVVMDENKHEKKEFFDLWKDKPGINLITYQNMIDFNGFNTADDDSSLSEDEIDKKYCIQRASKSFHCSQPWEMPIITVTGDVLPCGTPVQGSNKDFVLGNIMDGDTIASCWNGERMRNIRELHNNGEWYKNKQCRTCVQSLKLNEGGELVH